MESQRDCGVQGNAAASERGNPRQAPESSDDSEHGAQAAGAGPESPLAGYALSGETLRLCCLGQWPLQGFISGKHQQQA